MKRWMRRLRKPKTLPINERPARVKALLISSGGVVNVFHDGRANGPSVRHIGPTFARTSAHSFENVRLHFPHVFIPRIPRPGRCERNFWWGDDDSFVLNNASQPQYGDDDHDSANDV